MVILPWLWAPIVILPRLWAPIVMLPRLLPPIVTDPGRWVPIVMLPWWMLPWWAPAGMVVLPWCGDMVTLPWWPPTGIVVLPCWFMWLLMLMLPWLRGGEGLRSALRSGTLSVMLPVLGRTVADMPAWT